MLKTSKILQLMNFIFEIKKNSNLDEYVKAQITKSMLKTGLSHRLNSIKH